MNNAVEKLPIQFAGLHQEGRVPEWAKAWNATSTTLERLQAAEIPPGIVVIQSHEPSELVQGGPYLPGWGRRGATAAANPYLVVEFFEPAERGAAELAEVLRLLPDRAHVVFAYGPGELKKSLTQSIAKYLAHVGAPARTATDALGEAREVLVAVRPLLAPSGRLSAPKVAAAFGLSTASLGQLIGSSRQALGKTPDAPAIQEGLRPFERIARLRATLADADFRAWLHRPNRHLDDSTPMQVIEGGQPGIVADLVEAMLTGSPS